MFAALLWTYFEMPFHDAFTIRKPSEQLQSGPEIIPSHPEKIFWHADWSSVASLISLVLSSPVSPLKVSMYVVLGLPRFVWQCCGSKGSTFEVVSSFKIFPSESMVSYDVGALFTSVLVDKAVQHIRNRLENDERLENHTLARVLPHAHLFSVQGKLLLTKRRCGH